MANKSPVLFGRRMKRDPNSDQCCWYLDLAHFSFVVICPSTGSRHEAEFQINGFVEDSVDCSSLASALNWLVARRNRLVKSLTPEGR